MYKPAVPNGTISYIVFEVSYKVHVPFYSSKDLVENALIFINN